MAPASATIRVFAEPGHKRLFGSALDWPGWARRGKTEELALATLGSYLPRYAPIVARAGLAGAAPDQAAQGPARRRAGHRAWITAALRDPASQVTPPRGWPLRYAARRIGWHGLDHLWEIEDKS